MRLIFGLGNPGDRYRGTRHNVGFDVLSLLAERHKAERPRSKHQSLAAECWIGRHKSLLVWPQTYMNASGAAVRSAAAFYKAPLEDALVVCDDFNLPLGKLRLRAGGSSGGQNGLKDIVRQMGTDQFPRLRLGVGPLPLGRSVTGFVLGRFSEKERSEADLMTGRAAEAAVCWVVHGLQRAMNDYN